MVVRSFTFRTAFFAVGEHTPPEQLMLLVAAVEISTEACAGDARQRTADTPNAARAMLPLTEPFPPIVVPPLLSANITHFARGVLAVSRRFLCARQIGVYSYNE
jgi:hypothetical protein